MGDIRSWKRSMEDLFDERKPHYTDIDVIGEAKSGSKKHRMKGQKDRDNSWGVDPEMQIYITTDSDEAQEKRDWKAGRGNGPKDVDQELINMSRGYCVNVHKDFERYTNPDKHPKSTDGAKSVLPESEHAKIDLDADSVKPKKNQETHKSDSPDTIHNNFKKMADKLSVDFVDDFSDYTKNKPKKTDGEKSILPEDQKLNQEIFSKVSRRILSSEHELLKKHDIDDVLDAIEDVSSDDNQSKELNELVREVKKILGEEEFSFEMRSFMEIADSLMENRSTSLRDDVKFIMSVIAHTHGGMKKPIETSDTYQFLDSNQEKYKLRFINDGRFEVVDSDGHVIVDSDQSDDPTEELWNIAWRS